MILLFLAALAAQPTAADTPQSFLRHVYAGYTKQGFSPLEEPAKVFAPTLTAAIAKDSSGGEVGYLDGDPLCDCQDFERLTASVQSIRRPTRTSAVARVHVDLGGGATRDLRLSLIHTKAGWRIADVASTDGRSLLRELRRSNKDR